MVRTLLLISYLLACVPAKTPNHDMKDHAPVTHEHESHEKDEEGSLNSGSGASGSGEGKLVKFEHNIIYDFIPLAVRFSTSVLRFGCSLSP